MNKFGSVDFVGTVCLVNCVWKLVEIYPMSKPNTNFAFQTIQIGLAMVEICPRILKSLLVSN